MTTVFRSVDEARGRFGPCALTIGNFDGVHIGHQALLDQTIRYAAAHGFVSSVLTFDPHPTVVVAPQRTPLFISTLEQRLRLLSSAGIERILVLPFTAEVARLEPREFVWQILLNVLDTRAVFVGGNFRFGHKQAGTSATLRALGHQFGFVSKFVEPVSYRGETVSSSGIRSYLAAGNVSHAGRLLGRCFSVEGHVVPGRGIGAKQSVPTLNLPPAPGQIVPRGIYITETFDPEAGRRWESVTSVGTNPTFGETELSIETFLIAPPFDGQTPKQIEVLFRRFIRSERRFESSQGLKTQIMRDVALAQAYWRRISKFREAAASIY